MLSNAFFVHTVAPRTKCFKAQTLTTLQKSNTARTGKHTKFKSTRIKINALNGERISKKGQCAARTWEAGPLSGLGVGSEAQGSLAGNRKEEDQERNDTNECLEGRKR